MYASTSAATASGSQLASTCLRRAATAPNPAAQETPMIAAAERAAPRAMKATSSCGRRSMGPRWPNVRRKFTGRVSARGRQDKHHNRGMQSGLVLAIFGPTASGKTSVAEELVSRFPAELISADSMQVYRGLPILTNQPAQPTRLVGIWDLDHEASVAEYQRLAHEAVDEILAAGRTPIVVGGTGLYLRSALSALELPPPPRPGRREHWQRVYDTVGGERAHELLAERDPASAASVHPNDRRRVVRALELTDVGRSLQASDDRLWSADTRQPTVVAGLEVPREELLRRIEERTRAMFEAGVEAEVAQALAGPISVTARKAMGLEEI